MDCVESIHELIGSRTSNLGSFFSIQKTWREFQNLSSEWWNTLCDMNCVRRACPVHFVDRSSFLRS